MFTNFEPTVNFLFQYFSPFNIHHISVKMYLSLFIGILMSSTLALLLNKMCSAGNYFNWLGLNVTAACCDESKMNL